MRFCKQVCNSYLVYIPFNFIRAECLSSTKCLVSASCSFQRIVFVRIFKKISGWFQNKQNKEKNKSEIFSLIIKLEPKIFSSRSVENNDERIFYVFYFLLVVFSQVEKQRKRQHKEKKNLVLEIVSRKQRRKMFYSFIYLFLVVAVLIQLNQRNKTKMSVLFYFRLILRNLFVSKTLFLFLYQWPNY